MAGEHIRGCGFQIAASLLRKAGRRLIYHWESKRGIWGKLGGIEGLLDVEIYVRSERRMGGQVRKWERL